MIFSTALGPLVIGMMMDQDFPFYSLILSLALLLFLALLNSQRLSAKKISEDRLRSFQKSQGYKNAIAGK